MGRNRKKKRDERGLEEKREWENEEKGINSNWKEKINKI